MKSTILALAFLFASGEAFAGYQAKKFKVTVQNLTKGQPITPPVIAVHHPNYKMVKIGNPASQGLAELATDGKTDNLVQELADNRYVVRSAVGDGVTLPGKKVEIIVEANNPKYKISLVTMLARTNDAIVVAMDLPTKLRKGQKFSTLASVYDAGAEENSESCEHIPAPPCNNPGQGDAGEGFIRPHEGVQGLSDLRLNRDTFANMVAKVIIERIK